MSKLPKVILIEIASYLNDLWNLKDFIVVTKIIDPLKIKEKFIGHLCRVACDTGMLFSSRTHDLINAENSGINVDKSIRSLCVYTKIFDAIPIYKKWLSKRYDYPVYSRDLILNQDALISKIISETDICTFTSEYGVIYLYYTAQWQRRIMRSAFYLQNGEVANDGKITISEKCINITSQSGIKFVFTMQFLNSSNIEQIKLEYEDTLSILEHDGISRFPLKFED